MEILGLSYLFACMILFSALVIKAFLSGNGVVILDFNHYGELWAELLVVLVLLPFGWKAFMKNLKNANQRIKEAK